MMTRKSIISTACGFVLAMGLVIFLVLITMFLPSLFSPSIQNSVPLFIFIFSLFAVTPLLSWRLNRLPDATKVLGWTLAGTGAELIAFPFPLLFLALKSPSAEGLFLGGALLIYSVIFGIPGGLISITAGMFLIKRR